ncbi:hypothetical protein NE236_08195 [Actinoallomurus purpureus]|uniref:hypothetical protein n=1 Tax=Actinoallomurus purpureus TaxID=478114 RepID=UPI002093447D|nr:hypothetical protein [Actinoallomurus purpureus]MCO6004960.1 hypothetical protein [Actinoallomurus purpureus]
MTDSPEPAKSRYLVVHDYGMGGLWWWIRASSPEQIVDTFAEVEVVSDPEAVARAETWSLDEIDIDDVSLDPALASLRTKRDGYRDRPGYGALAGRDRVYIDMPDEDDEDTRYLLEIGSDGRWLRQVTLTGDGPGVRTDSEDWPINSPLDLYDPQYAAMEIETAAFENAWSRAFPDPEDPR